MAHEESHGPDNEENVARSERSDNETEERRGGRNIRSRLHDRPSSALPGEEANQSGRSAATAMDHQSMLRKQSLSATHGYASSGASRREDATDASRAMAVAPLRAYALEEALAPRNESDGEMETQLPGNASRGWSHVKKNQEDLSGTAPCERSLHTAAVLNGCMYVFGGYDGQSRVNDFHAYSFAERRWSPVLPSATSGPPPSPRDRHASVARGNSFYVFGGFAFTSRVSDFHEFDFSSMTWRAVTSTGSPPSPRHSHSAVVHEESMYVFGGYDGSYRSDFHEFDFASKTWSSVPSTGWPPRARYRATTVVYKDVMLLFGGHDGTRHLSDTHAFDFKTNAWSTLIMEGGPPIPRDSHVSVVHNDSMYIFGGSTGSAMNDLHQLDLTHFNKVKWSPVVSSSTYVTPGHRFCHVAVLHDNAMYVFGGYDGTNRLNDFIKFDFEIDDLSCTIPPSTLIADLRSFINNDTMSDITLLVENRPIYAHKIILMRSSYFRAMFSVEMRESTQSTIPLSQVRYPIFLSILEYLYTDAVSINISDAMELFVAADQFCIPRLKAICEKNVLASIVVDNAACMYHAADNYSALNLKQKTLKFILAHFESVSKTKSFEEMARGNVELVFEILRNR